MSFYTIPFILFFLAFFLLYWFVCNRNLRLQNLLILAGCYFFYAWWDWRFLLLLIGSTMLTYQLGMGIEKAESAGRKKALLATGVLFNVGILLYFKYTNFFISSFISLLGHFNVHSNVRLLNIILPLGISFYTFRLLSYLWDVKNGKTKAVQDPVVFSSYVAFFPSLISGPIDRAKTLVPQLEKSRVFQYDMASDGMRQILWGLFKKIVVADNCAKAAADVFDTPTLHGPVLIAGAFFFTIQMYADFSGYSDMAIGIAKLLGFNITRNFNYPYFSQNIAEFWRKWHISLTTWLTDYVFTPLSISFRNFGNAGLCIAIVLTFLVSGLWHGANWTFIVWGFLHGCYYIPLILKGKMNKKKEIPADRYLPTFKEFRNIVGTFLLVMFTMVIFKAESLAYAGSYFRRLFILHGAAPHIISSKWFVDLFFVAGMFAIEWFNRAKQHPLENMQVRIPRLGRWAVYNAFFILIILYTGQSPQFIYAKF